eukprot:TRINITY_DN37584_c0_g1_i1.p1 TRINITY_DN37584_c0_g1~~TRINITY_DN37584_c0_g1_i1.p1  ORF type:complete len:538 (-),score=103.14 TRINITY_DN37584_c0_g1_i1:17-1630(-)
MVVSGRSGLAAGAAAAALALALASLAPVGLAEARAATAVFDGADAAAAEDGGDFAVEEEEFDPVEAAVRNATGGLPFRSLVEKSQASGIPWPAGNSTTQNVPDPMKFQPDIIKWRTWPGLNAEFVLATASVVLFHYKILMPLDGNDTTDGSHSAPKRLPGELHTKLFVDGKERRPARSSCGYAIYCYTFGVDVDFLSEGMHHVEVMYRTNSVKTVDLNVYNNSLNVLQMAEAVGQSINPSYECALSPTNLWYSFPGLEHTVNITHRDPILAITHATFGEYRSFTATRLLFDGEELPAARSGMGDTHYHTHSGLLVFSGRNGVHNMKVQYRTDAKNLRFKEMWPNYLQTRSLALVQLRNANASTHYVDDEVKLIPGAWQAWPNLTRQVFAEEGTQSSFAAVSFSIGCRLHQPMVTSRLSDVLAAMFVDGKMQNHTLVMCHNVTACTLNGMWIGSVSETGTLFEVRYFTHYPTVMVPKDNSDWNNQAMTVMVLPHVTTSVVNASLLVPENVGQLLEQMPRPVHSPHPSKPGGTVTILSA